jgi:hypothetical protein
MGPQWLDPPSEEGTQEDLLGKALPNQGHKLGDDRFHRLLLSLGQPLLPRFLMHMSHAGKRWQGRDGVPNQEPLLPLALTKSHHLEPKVPPDSSWTMLLNDSSDQTEGTDLHTHVEEVLPQFEMKKDS